MSQCVLAIDDSSDVHGLLDVRLRTEGLIVHHALDGEQGLVMARDIRPDIILLDVDMPLFTGFEVCQRLKLDPLTEPIPVIFLTGATEVYSKVQGFDLGAVDYLTKPFEPAELRARVRAALRTKRYHDILASRSHVDGLTGLWNRAYFDQRMIEECSAARRYLRKLSLILLDLDHFIGLNDSHGRPFGDHALQILGDHLSSIVRGTDAPCRYGGEEFGIILAETDLAGAVAMSERLRREMSELSFQTSERRLSVTASQGVACSSIFDVGAITVGGMIDAADGALYRAKREGRDRVCVATEGSQAGAP